MRAGRKPTPTELKKLRGNPGKRPLPKSEPRVARRKRAPSAPAYLGEEAAAEWKRVAPLLLNMRVLTDADLTALSAYCEAYGRWLEACRLLDREGLVLETDTTIKTHPAATVRNACMQQMRQFMVEFGMTPSSRSRVRVDQPAEKSEFERFLEARRGANG